MQNLSQVIAPLLKLLRKNVPFIWSQEFNDSFKEAKKLLTRSPPLAFPQPTGLLIVATDAWEPFSLRSKEAKNAFWHS